MVVIIRRKDEKKNSNIIHKSRYGWNSINVCICKLLRKRGEEEGYYFEGIPKKEDRIVSELFNIKLEKTHTIHDNDKFVLVDTNDVVELPKYVIKENVVEIIDNHKKREWLTWNEN